MSSVTVVDHSVEVIGFTNESIKLALTATGFSVAGHAKELSPVDTGFLRNSITFGLGGEVPKIAEYSDDKGEQHGRYEDSCPADDEGKATVYVGTNVEYAPYVELGHKQEPGRYVPAIGKRLKKPFVAGKAYLRPAFENNMEEIRQIFEKYLKDI